MSLRSIVEKIIQYFSEKDKAREEIIRLGREVLRASNDAVNNIIRGNFEAAEEVLRRLDELVKKLLETARPHPELYYSGLINNPVSEYVEAKVLYTLLKQGRYASPEELGVPYLPYLHGLCDAVGELRRLFLDELRMGRFSEASRLLSYMEEIYLELRTVDFPDALIPGIRHKVDVVRRLVEDSKALLLDLENRKVLESEMKKLLEELRSRGRC